MKRPFVCLMLVIAFVICSQIAFAQPAIVIVDSGHKASLRGLSVVDNNTVWASGSNGTVAKSLDGGKTFEWLTVKGYETRDFRDVEAFSADTALIMAIAEPAIILKTYDGGKTWKEVFKDTTKGMFLDAMDFRNTKHGVVIGDPLKNRPFLAYTEDGGEHWLTFPEKDSSGLPALVAGEAFFASSGTNIVDLTDDMKDGIPQLGSYLYVSGGMRSIFYALGFLGEKVPLTQRKTSKGANSIAIPVGFFEKKMPLTQGKTSTGANSIAISYDNSSLNNFVVVGGDFANNLISDSNCVLLQINSGHYKSLFPQTPPHGYRSCVIFLAKDKLITCGTSGVDISNDGGNNWQLISRQSFHVCQKAKKGNAVFLAGANGKIAVYR